MDSGCVINYRIDGASVPYIPDMLVRVGDTFSVSTHLNMNNCPLLIESVEYDKQLLANQGDADARDYGPGSAEATGDWSFRTPLAPARLALTSRSQVRPETHGENVLVFVTVMEVEQ